MQLSNRIKRIAAVAIVAAGTLLSVSQGVAGPFDFILNAAGLSINRHGADDPAGHDAGDDRGRGRGRGGNGNVTPTPTPAGVDDHGHHGPGHH